MENSFILLMKLHYRNGDSVAVDFLCNFLWNRWLNHRNLKESFLFMKKVNVQYFVFSFFIFFCGSMFYYWNHVLKSYRCLRVVFLIVSRFTQADRVIIYVFLPLITFNCYRIDSTMMVIVSNIFNICMYVLIFYFMHGWKLLVNMFILSPFQNIYLHCI